MENFVVVLILSGSLDLTDRRKLWETVGDTRSELVSKSIYRNRLEVIMSN